MEVGCGDRHCSSSIWVDANDLKTCSIVRTLFLLHRKSNAAVFRSVVLERQSRAEILNHSLTMVMGNTDYLFMN